MSVLRQLNVLGQQRLDVPHVRSIESAVAADFDIVIGRVQTGAQPIVITGFTLANAAPGTAATSVQLSTAGGIVYNLNASESGSFMWVPANRPVEVLSPTTNARVIGSFTASQTNYVGVDLVRSADASTSDLVQFLDANTLIEQPKNIPLGRTLDYVVVISTTPFSATPNLVPIAKIVTDASNNVSSVADARNLMFRLGAGGDFPNSLSFYSWPQGRGPSSTGFTGGDKGIANTKDWMSAAMTRIWEIGGGEFWYSATADRNVTMIWTGATFTNGENFEWVSSNLHWKGLKFVFDNSTGYYNDVADQTSDNAGQTDLADGQCLYVDLDRSSNHTGGTALIAVKATLTTLGPGTVPGARQILAWRIGSLIYTRNWRYAVGTTFVPATPTSLGVVKLSVAASTPSTPIVISDGGGTIQGLVGGVALSVFGFNNTTGIGMYAQGGNGAVATTWGADAFQTLGGNGNTTGQGGRGALLQGGVGGANGAGGIGAVVVGGNGQGAGAGGTGGTFQGGSGTGGGVGIQTAGQGSSLTAPGSTSPGLVATGGTNSYAAEFNGTGTGYGFFALGSSTGSWGGWVRGFGGTGGGGLLIDGASRSTVGAGGNGTAITGGAGGATSGAGGTAAFATGGNATIGAGGEGVNSTGGNSANGAGANAGTYLGGNGGTAGAGGWGLKATGGTNGGGSGALGGGLLGIGSGGSLPAIIGAIGVYGVGGGGANGNAGVVGLASGATPPSAATAQGGVVGVGAGINPGGFFIGAGTAFGIAVTSAAGGASILAGGAAGIGLQVSGSGTGQAIRATGDVQTNTNFTYSTPVSRALHLHPSDFNMYGGVGNTNPQPNTFRIGTRNVGAGLGLRSDSAVAVRVSATVRIPAGAQITGLSILAENTNAADKPINCYFTLLTYAAGGDYVATNIDNTNPNVHNVPHGTGILWRPVTTGAYTNTVIPDGASGEGVVVLVMDLPITTAQADVVVHGVRITYAQSTVAAAL